MTQKRMFSLQIVDTDAFLDMPQSSQLLYFHLAMRADDEGFVSSPKKVMKIVGSGEDDYRVLVTKKFVIPFESGICVIKHWLIHNIIRMDRFNETTYKKEKSQLSLKENKAYTLKQAENNYLATNWQPSGNHLVPQVKLSKVNLSKDNTYSKTSSSVCESLSLLDRLKPTKEKNAAPTKERTPKEDINEVISAYDRQYRYITGQPPVIAKQDYIHIANILKKLPKDQMLKMIPWYVKMENTKFMNHPNLKSIFTPENINKFNLGK